MKSMKGRFLKKLKFIPSINTLKQGLVSQLNHTEKFSNQTLQIPSVYIQDDDKRHDLSEAAAENISVPKHVADLQDEEAELELDVCDKETITPSIMPNDKVSPLDNSESSIPSEITMDKAHNEDEENPSLLDFEENFPPGGNESVILYTTSMRSIRKTFEDCHAVRFLLESFRVKFHERDVSMDMGFREELWRILRGRVIPPRLFIKGRYIGGADEVVCLHEQGKLRKLLEGIPINGLSNSPCTACGNMRFVVCLGCHGSRKVFTEEGDNEGYIRCTECNENGLVACSNCS